MASTSQTARKLTTLLDQMRDEARGARIKGLRVGTPGMTQPKIVEGLERLAGHHVVTLRGYQEWERTGAMRYENAVLLAGFYEIDVGWLWTGEQSGDTPSLVDTLNGNSRTEVDVEVLQRLVNIEEKLDLLVSALRLLPTEGGATLEEAIVDLEQARRKPPRIVEDEGQGPTDAG